MKDETNAQRILNDVVKIKKGDLSTIAHLHKALFDAYILAGFTENQAIEIISKTYRPKE